MATQRKLRRGTAAEMASFTGAADEITYESDTGDIVLHDGVTAGGKFRPGFPRQKKIAFFEASPPVGWTQDTNVNDQVFRVVSGAGGGTGGSWTISGISAAATTLTTTQMPAHTHNQNINTVLETGSSASRGTGGADWGSGGLTGSVGGSGSHGHSVSSDGSWRPSYIDVIVASKD